MDYPDNADSTFRFRLPCRSFSEGRSFVRHSPIVPTKHTKHAKSFDGFRS
jgi:hypothetical protein